MTNFDRRAHCAHALKAVTPSDTVDIEIVDLSGLTEEEQGSYYPRGFHSNMTGIVELEPAGNAASDTVIISVVAGAYYPYSFKKILASTTGSLTSGCADMIIALR